MTGRKPRRPAAGLLIGAAMTLMPLAAQAYYPCDPSLFEPVPDCEPQQKAPVEYPGDFGGGWAYYCTGDHPYYWGPNASYYANFTWNNSCFSAAENWWNETTPNKFDANIANWCVFSPPQTIIVTLGCSKDPPPGYLPSCPTVGGAVPDPGCKQSNQHTYCQNPGGVPVCFETYTETCTNDRIYLCTADQGASWCQQCQQ